ncbi:glycosyltransferase family 2 protein [Cellulomonas marina]|uniref:Glycosyltransferase, catalytic subunit of cellulose synthase and poly-beta-1,6-N-acetylglucosamine synthase n=1 Tax=Cellulomonas marina TaxID=988821 RepID=A0A1I0X1A9_9CELL|nr:glycosyltransferase family 2 protein [Cellulomonas marina]GIG29379.1 hypothetical protein Cma02nite_19790 [Cellulomonas marina]SFA94799.1 Glycosyltransferase, catalytic subunit of cellulose synthase and poly-beta-1,6-N-acetylglucosamine synthase [Cellulomonas marina]
MSAVLAHATTALGWVLFVGISVIGVRMLSYWRSFLFSWRRYRHRDVVSTAQLRLTPVPFVKVQITTRGSAGSSEVIQRGIDNVMALAAEDPEFYGEILSVEVVTESLDQATLLHDRYAPAPVDVSVLLLPADYQTPGGTQLKARGLHYAVERRRAGWNAKPGRTFVVHYDEESVLTPSEFRKLLAHLATTDKKVLEGPIYYPLEYLDASALCRAMEANRPVGCFECRQVMEDGVPLHLHGSNLVVDEAFENEIGWDIGALDGQPLIAEDYVFGMKAFTAAGSEVFGWHGCAMLEQPPFSVRSAFKQRHRWIFGVLQGMALNRRLPEFRALPARTRAGIVWGTRFRIGTFALGAVVGSLSLLLLPVLLTRSVAALLHDETSPLPWPAMTWLAVLGALWLGSVGIGAWYNVAEAGMSRGHRLTEIARAVAIAPVAGLIESAAGLWAVTEWGMGRREVFWQPTPKTKSADATAVWSAEEELAALAD